MDIKTTMYLERAENKIIFAKTNYDISTQKKLKQTLNLDENKTFFNEVISECYYAIFYSAKAFLTEQKIYTSPPEEHKKTYEQFKKRIIQKNIHKKLNEIYEEETQKAQTLLKIFFEEKRNRGRFTYKINANANKPFAKQSIKNAITFVSTIKKLIEIQKFI